MNRILAVLLAIAILHACNRPLPPPPAQEPEEFEEDIIVPDPAQEGAWKDDCGQWVGPCQTMT